MPRTIILTYTGICLMLICLAGCTKTVTTNNYIAHDNLAAFTVEGLKDIVISTDNPIKTLALKIVHTDSGQQKVTISIAGLPVNLRMNENYIHSGYPTFAANLTFYDTNLVAPVTPGVYPVTLSLLGTISGLKQFSFNIIVLEPSSCTDIYVGKHGRCNTTCSGAIYADSIFADVGVKNKIWFNNFNNSGKLIYGTVNCTTGYIDIPAQMLDTAICTGTINPIIGSVDYRLYASLNLGTRTCHFYMN